METAPGGPPPGKSDGGTYADKTAMNHGQKTNKLKLNILDIFLERKDPSINYTLNKEELSKLLFQRMKIPPNQVTKIDTSAYGKIHLELSPQLIPEKFMNLPAFDIRDGLRTKFYRPHHKKEVLVTFSWLDLETSDDFLCHILSFFGKIKSGVQYSKFREEPGESNEAKLLNNILSGERKVWMEVEKSIPSYAVVSGRRIKIFYNGQRRTCARCCKPRELCPGESNARVCEQNGGEKVKTEKMWKETLETVGYIPWAGEEAEVTVTDNPEKEVIEAYEDEGKFDGVTLDNLKENSTDNEIMELLRKVCSMEEMENITIHPTGSTKSKLLKFSDQKPIPAIWKKMDQKIFDGRMIHSRPHVPLTPPKPSVQQSGPAFVESTEPNKSETKTPTKKSMPPPKSTPKIPGLTEEDIAKAAKIEKKKRKKKENAKKPKSSKGKKDENKTEKRTDEMVKEDFLYGSDDSIAEKSLQETIKAYDFSDYDTDSESEVFEDSKEDPDAENLFTPMRWKSKSAANIVLSVTQDTPHRRANSLNRKRSATSPKEQENKKKKSHIPLKTSSRSSNQ